MYGQLDVEAISKTFKETGKISNFYEFGSEELHYEK
jgi:hypothetical protein